MRLITYIILLTIIFGCKKPNERSCWKSNGEVSYINTNITTTNNKITVFDDLNLILINDSLNEIIIEGPKNLIKLIKIDQKNHQITIKNNNRCDFLRKDMEINIHYHYKQLDTIILKGYGNVNNNGKINHSIFINAKDALCSINLKLNNDSNKIIIQNGSTDINLSGNCSYFYFYNEGFGPLKAFELEAKKTHIHSNSISNSEINVTEQLNAEIRNNGNIYYKGTPAIIQTTISGNGRLIPQ